MSTKQKRPVGLNQLLSGEQVTRQERDGRMLYHAVDIVAAIAETAEPAEFLADLKTREPQLANVCETIDWADGESADAVDLDGLLRLVQSIASVKAERLKLWLAKNARERLQEADDPELAILRARRDYEHQGRSRQWIDQRLRSISARHELTGEWYKRGATESEQFRVLTNDLMQAAFGMDVEGYRRYKGLIGTTENLRDHMTDLELILTTLGETTAAVLHRGRASKGFEQLEADIKTAGEIVAKARQEIEAQSGTPAINPGNNVPAKTLTIHRDKSAA